MKTPSNFLYFDTASNEWAETTLDALASTNEPETHIVPVYDDGSQGPQTTWGQWQKVQALVYRAPVQKNATPQPSAAVQYEVITHDRYHKGTFDAKGLKKKLNECAAKGYRLAAFGVVSGVPNPEEVIEKGVLDSFFGSDSAGTINDYRVALAIMEKQG